MKILFQDGDEVKPFQVNTAEALRAEIKQVGAWVCGKETPSGTGQEGGKPKKPSFPSETFSSLKTTTGRQDQTTALQAEGGRIFTWETSHHIEGSPRPRRHGGRERAEGGEGLRGPCLRGAGAGAQLALTDSAARGPVFLALERRHPRPPQSTAEEVDRILKVNLEEGREGAAGSRKDERKDVRSKTSSAGHGGQRVRGSRHHAEGHGDGRRTDSGPPDTARPCSARSRYAEDRI